MSARMHDDALVSRYLEEPSRPPGGHLTDFELLRLGRDSSLDEQAPSHLEDCRDCRGRLEAVRADRDALLARLPPERLTEVIRARLRERRPLSPVLLKAALAVSMAIAIVWAILPGRISEDDGRSGAETLAKGIDLRIFVKRGQATFRANEQTEYLPRDALRLELAGVQVGYVHVLSRRGAQVVPLMPDDKHEPERLETGLPLAYGDGVFTFPASFVLDAEPGPERLLILLSGRPLSSRAAVRLVSEVGQARMAAGGPIRLGRHVLWSVDVGREP